ncbi:MAG: NAD-dependent epimerase/dehydratase family protein [Bacteroidia bacterium]|nr:NAD-dependent epimerase/dehydratase family protein [Bacteroidia bacterium]
MKKILVTGGAGNVGSALVEKLIEKEDNFVVIADDLSTGFLYKLPKNHKERWRFEKCDVNNESLLSALMKTEKFDYVFHFAAVVGVQRTQEHPISVLRDIDGIKNILDLSINSSVKHVYFSSSSEVYGEPVELPQHEYKTPLNSRVPYAVVKNVAECFFRSYEQEYGLNYTIFRFFNTYGPNQSTDFVVSRFLAAALKGQDITIYGDGSQTRTFSYVDDTIDTCLACHYQNKIINDVINIGSDKLVTINELAQLVISMTNSKSKVIFLPPLKEGDMTRRQPDNSKMRELLGRELIPLDEGIKRMMNDKNYLASIGV